MAAKSLTSTFVDFPGGQHRNIQPFSDEDASIETMSHCSGYSDPSSFAEDGMPFTFHSHLSKNAFRGGILLPPN